MALPSHWLVSHWDCVSGRNPDAAVLGFDEGHAYEYATLYQPIQNGLGIGPVPLAFPDVPVGEIFADLLINNSGSTLVRIKGMALVKSILVIKAEITGLVLRAPSQVPFPQGRRLITTILEDIRDCGLLSVNDKR